MGCSLIMSSTITDVYPYLNKDELEQVTNILLEACSRNGKEFDVFDPVLKIESF